MSPRELRRGNQTHNKEETRQDLRKGLGPPTRLEHRGKNLQLKVHLPRVGQKVIENHYPAAGKNAGFT